MIAFNKTILLTTLSLILSLISFVAFARGITFGARLCQEESPYYTCHIVKRGETWQKLFPDPEQMGLVKRINRLGNRLQPGMRIVIPKDLSTANLMTYSPFPLQISPPGEKVIFVSLTNLAWGAYNADGDLVRWGPASGGKGYCPDLGQRCNTATGTFTIYRKQGPHCVSTKFPVGRGGAPMPYCMFFHGGYALHGSYDMPGYNASHGCVRLFVDDAEWLNQEFVDSDNVRVVISHTR